MAVEYDNDDIVEDYEVVGEDGDDNENVRRVSSAGGGPVKRPSESVKPDQPPTSMVGALDDGMPNMPTQKGQISQKSAKMIWFVSIGVSVLCVAAVVGHIVFRGGGDNAANRQNNNQNRGPSRPTVELTAEQKAGQEFRNAVYKSMKADVSKSSAWRNFVKLQGAWVDLRDKAAQKLDAYQNEKATKEEAQEAVVEALNKCYEALYAFELCRYAYDKNMKKLGFLAIGDLDVDSDIVEYEEKLRTNSEVIAYQAYIVHAVGRNNNAHDWQKGKTGGLELVVGQKEWEAKWADAKAKWDNSRYKNEFDAEDLKEYTTNTK